MNDTISRAKAIEQMSLYGSVWMEYTDDMTKEQIAEEALRESKWALIKVVSNMPSAQPDIIRCRNCKFASGDSRICMKFGHSPIGELDFCAWAERRTDE